MKIFLIVEERISWIFIMDVFLIVRAYSVCLQVFLLDRLFGCGLVRFEIAGTASGKSSRSFLE